MSKLALVTGGSVGIGLAVSAALAKRGYELLLISSNPAKLESARTFLKQNGATSVELAAIDFADLKSVADFASQFQNNWDLLVNNAGIKIQADAKPTQQGLERHLGINHLAHFVLTNGILAQATTAARIVTVSSIVARMGSDNPLAHPNATTSQCYANSKLANLAFALELDQRLRNRGSEIRSLAAHPGFTKAEPYGTRITRVGETLFAQSCERGALPILDAALADSPIAYSGPRTLELWGPSAQARIPKIALDETWRANLWRDSEVLAQQALGL